MVSLICGTKKKKRNKEKNKPNKTETHRYREQAHICQSGWLGEKKKKEQADKIYINKLTLKIRYTLRLEKTTLFRKSD